MSNIGDFDIPQKVFKAISIVCVNSEQCHTPEPTAAPSDVDTMTSTNSPTRKPTLAPTRILTTVTTSTRDVCPGKNRGKCKKTDGCRFVNYRKGCQVRIRPCSFFRKNQCKNSHGCVWAKKGKACVSVM